MSGISALLPPAVSPDGECSHVVNLRCRDGVWSPVGTPTCCYTPADASHRLVFVHVNEAYKHYFTYDGTTLFYEAEEIDGAIVPLKTPPSFEISGLVRIEAVGNAMVVFTETSMQYLFYVDGTYRFIGERPDFPEITFTLKEKTSRSEVWDDYVLVSSSTPDANFVLSDNDKLRFTSLVYGTYSRAKSALLDDGYLSFPFLVRYALRLYDDSYIYPSPPVLICSSDALPFVNNLASMCKIENKAVVQLYHNPFTLSGEKVYYTVNKANLEAWSDVIKGVDVFFSRELPVVKDATIESYYLVQEPDGNGDPVPVMRFSMPVLSDDEQREQIVNESLFYKVASFDIEELKADPEKATPLTYTCSLSNLVQQRNLTLDNFSLHTLRAKDSYVYNGRLHLGNVTTRFFDGYPLMLFALAQEHYHGAMPTFHNMQGFVRVTLKGTTGQSKMISPFEYATYRLSPYLSYPDSRAVSIEILGFSKSGAPAYYGYFPLKAAPNENMAYYLNNGFSPIELNGEISSSLMELFYPEEKNPEEYVPGKLRVSAVYNPFSFPQNLTYTLSAGAILGMAAATAALSQGQYGEFPLYVFTSDGIWALRQGSGDVLYASQSPVNREVALSPRHIISVDDAVLYLSEQGLMALLGSDSELLSRPFDGTPDAMPGPALSVLDATEPVMTSAVDDTPFRTFVKNADVGYNYIEKELLFLSPDYPYMWVFDLLSAQWTRRSTTYASFYSLYPTLLAVDESSNIYDLCDEQEADEVEVALVTRAVKLLPDVTKRTPWWTLRCRDDNALLNFSLWASNRADEGYGAIFKAQAEGALPGRVVLRTIAPPYKYHRLSLSGRVSSRFHLDAVDVVYEPVFSSKPI